VVEVCEHPGALRALTTEQGYVSTRSQLSPMATSILS